MVKHYPIQKVFGLNKKYLLFKPCLKVIPANATCQIADTLPLPMPIYTNHIKIYMHSKLNQVECQLDLLGQFVDLGVLLVEEHAVYKRKRFSDEKVRFSLIFLLIFNYMNYQVATSFTSVVCDWYTIANDGGESTDV